MVGKTKKIGTKEILLLSFGIVILIIIISNLGFYNNPKNKLIKSNEEKITKNKYLTIKTEEEYEYVIDKNNFDNATIIRYTTKLGTGSCVDIYINDMKTDSCIKPDGTDKDGSNLTLKHPQIIFFKPWMLALNSNWTWKAGYKTKYMEKNLIGYEFKVVREEKIYGRDSYVVETTSDGDNKTKITDWIDKEKRVLLKETSGDYNIIIIDAPFPLNKTEIITHLKQ